MKPVVLKRGEGFEVLVGTKDEEAGYLVSSSVEANLLYAVLEKLEEIRCSNIDIEEAIRNENK